MGLPAGARLGSLILLLGIFLSAAMPGHAAPAADYWAFWDASDEANRRIVDHDPWDTLLQRFATRDPGSGIVSFSYDDLTRQDVKSLRKYVDDLEDVDPRRYPRLEQKAYWMNLYNALTVLAVHENLRTLSKTGFQQGLPEKAWGEKRVKVARQKLSLNDIEHRILRPIYRDHRILFGLNCTTLDCPNFSERAYTAVTIKEQLKTAGMRFINNNIGVRYADGVLHASRMFHEYMKDFAEDEKMLTKVFAHYAQDMKALYMLGYTGNINYTRDSRLNIR